jgi:hypothetical protein
MVTTSQYSFKSDNLNNQLTTLEPQFLVQHFPEMLNPFGATQLISWPSLLCNVMPLGDLLATI